MRKAVKEQMLQLLDTLQDAHREIHKFLGQKEYDNVRGILADCQDGAVLVGSTIERFENNQADIINMLEEYCEYLFFVHEGLESVSRMSDNEIKNELDRRIRKIYEAVKNKVQVQLKVVFMPYKASMWTSLASIWKAAQKDPECEVKVVVIPYYNLDEQQRPKKIVYEAELFPKDVPIVPYDQYDLNMEQPDMIFIHNPYDDTNNVTRVPEQYYSYNLKKFTEQLIYSPYGLMGYFDSNEGAFMCCTNAVRVSDKVLVQSEKVKQIYISHGVERNKLIALGSPKVDAVVEGMKMPLVYPKGWEEKLKGRKVFLVNTHLSYFIRGYVYALNNPGKRDFAKWSHERILKPLLNREGCAMIWRPHPLLKATLESRKLYDSLEFVNDMEQRIMESDNAVLDENGEYDISFRISDALVTTYSSMIAEYMITGKPIYVYQQPLNVENCRKSPVNYENIYCRPEPGKSFWFVDFIDMVLQGEDILYEQRMKDIQRAFPNREGTIGREIYSKLKDEWIFL